MSDLRFGAGYNFTQRDNRVNQVFDTPGQTRGGFYFTITTKLSNLFDLFGTSRNGLTNDEKPESNVKNPDK